ncbi:P-loop containing nucleoside triphosphate hydrolase protein [Acephala macrosclerotiorum]|nr:P-loop containing nucleoside triphosphate hydrolase protein [Acephala macrosclerotiorum]
MKGLEDEEKAREQTGAGAQGIGGADSKDAEEEDQQDDDDDDDDYNDEEDAERSFEVYKHREKKKAAEWEESSDEEINLGDYEKLEFGRDFIEVNGEHIHATKFFGNKYTERIRALYGVKAMAHPEHMNIVLHYHQLKGAAQLDFLCRSSFRGGILADQMGVGKTLTAVTLMFMVKDEPGFSMVVAPKSLCLQWVSDIEGAWQEGYGMKAYLLEGSSITAHELLALGVDVIVCSYDQVEASERAQRNLIDGIDAYNNDQTGSTLKPKRPIAALHSSFWLELKLPIKRLILDEAQVVNKRNGVRHKAVKRLNAKAVVVLSGTLAHNKWHNFSGLIDFLAGHPFTTHKLFMRAFATQDYDGKISRPDLPRMRLLQRFIQAFTVARPSSILKQTNCIRYRSSFEIEGAVLNKVNELYAKYAQLAAMDRPEPGFEDSSKDSKVGLSYAVQGQVVSLHPMLMDGTKHAIADDFVDMDEEDPVAGYVAADAETKSGEARDAWLQKIRERKFLVHESNRLRHFLRVYKQLRTTNPEQKILVFSQYLKFLDIIHEAMSKVFNIQCLRIDGTVGYHQRVKALQDFKDSDPSVPLLMTAGCGAYGLNVTQASIVIQCEVWWNLSVELQSIARAHRQKQESDVLAVQLFASNSPIDKELLGVQRSKACITSELMEAIFRLPDEEPDIRELCFPLELSPMTFEEYDNLKARAA